MVELLNRLGTGCPADPLGQSVWPAAETGVVLDAVVIGDNLRDEAGVRIRGTGGERDVRAAMRETVVGILGGESPRLHRLVGQPARGAYGGSA